jgi:hypothetical protein
MPRFAPRSQVPLPPAAGRGPQPVATGVFPPAPAPGTAGVDPITTGGIGGGNVSFTTSNPVTLQALRERYQRLQETAPQLPSPQGMQSPWQGAAYLANTLVNSLQQNAAATAEQRGTQAMMDVFGQIDPAKGATPEQLAQIGRYDPEMAIKLWTDRAQRLQNQVRTVTGDQAKAMGLDPTRTWQVDNSGKANDITPNKAQYGPIITGEEAKAQGLDPNLRYQFNVTTGKYDQVGSTPPSAQPPAEYQSRDLGYYSTGSAANDSLTESGGDKALRSVDTAFWSSLAGMSGTDALSSITKAFANRQLTPEQQMALNDALNFSAAILRKESGAALTPDDIATTFERFIPKYGDSDQIVEQKRQMRQDRLKALTYGLSGRPELQAVETDLNTAREKRRKAREAVAGGGGGTDTGDGTLPPGTKVTDNPDGTRTYTMPDGVVVTTAKPRKVGQ